MESTEKSIMQEDLTLATLESGGTIRMMSSELDFSIDGNNDPARPIEAENLDLDPESVERLSLKPNRKYRFIKGLGKGGMKMVLQVRDQDTTRDVAMAVLPDAAARPESDIYRFLQEARITASLEHPNIVPVHDIGVDASGAPYYTMKLLRGRTLASLISKLASGDPEFTAEYNPDRMLRIFLKICYGMAFAHSKGVIHLDLKPENIQLGDFGEVLILDWGLAKVMDKDAVDENHDGKSEPEEPVAGFNTQDGIMKGTPGYMAPEQAAGQNSKKDQRTDIYALGAILYSMMTYCDPLEEKNVKDRINATLNGRIVPPRERAQDRDIPAAVEAVILKAMSLHPDDRYQSVKEIRNEVNAFISGYATVAENASFLKKLLLFLKRHMIFVLFGLLLLFLIAAGTVYMLDSHKNALAEWKELSSMQENTGYYRKTDPANQHSTGAVAPRADGSVVLGPGEWLWWDYPLQNDRIKAEFSFEGGDSIVPVDCMIAPANVPLKNAGDLPAGYCIRFGSDGFDRILRCGEDGAYHVLAAEKTRCRTAALNRFYVIRDLDRILVYCGAERVPYLQVSDPLPLTAPQKMTVAVRASSERPLEVKKLTVHTQPLVSRREFRGDVFFASGDYRHAFAQYISLAELYPDQGFADTALIQAFRIAVLILKDEDLSAFTRELICKRPTFTEKAAAAQLEVLALWDRGKYDEALDGCEKLFAGKYNTAVMEEILKLPHRKLPDHIAEKFLALIRRSSGLQERPWLDLSGYGLRSLKKLKGMKTVWLDVRGNPDLDPATLPERSVIFSRKMKMTDK